MDEYEIDGLRNQTALVPYGSVRDHTGQPLHPTVVHVGAPQTAVAHPMVTYATPHPTLAMPVQPQPYPYPYPHPYPGAPYPYGPQRHYGVPNLKALRTIGVVVDVV